MSDQENADLAAHVADGGLELVVSPEDLEFKIRVPAGCVIVAALRLPSGQLVELADLVAEDAAGIPVGDPLRTPGVGPVDESKVAAARAAERAVRDAAKGPGRGRKHALAGVVAPESPEVEQQAVRDHLRSKMVAERPSDDPEDRRCFPDGTGARMIYTGPAPGDEDESSDQ